MSQSEWLVGWKSIANYFGVSIMTVRRWHDKWTMPLLKLGRKVMAKPGDLDLWAQRKAVIF